MTEPRLLNATDTPEAGETFLHVNGKRYKAIAADENSLPYSCGHCDLKDPRGFNPLNDCAKAPKCFSHSFDGIYREVTP